MDWKVSWGYSAEDYSYNKHLFRLTSLRDPYCDLSYKIHTVCFWCLFWNTSFFSHLRGKSCRTLFLTRMPFSLTMCWRSAYSWSRESEPAICNSASESSKSGSACGSNLFLYLFYFLCLLSSFCFIQLASYHLFSVPHFLASVLIFSHNASSHAVCHVDVCLTLRRLRATCPLLKRRCEKLPFPLCSGSGSSQPPVIILFSYLLPHIITPRTNTAVWHSQSHCHFFSPNQSLICHITSPSCLSFKADKYMFINSVYVQH